MDAPDELVEAALDAIEATRGVLDVDTDGIPESQWRVLADAVLAVPAIADALRAAEEVEVLDDDLLRVLQVRNAALLVAAEHIQPGPDGQDYIDREAMIREWVDEGHERVDDYRAEHQRLVLEAIEWRRAAERDAKVAEEVARLPWGATDSQMVGFAENIAALYPEATS